MASSALGQTLLDTLPPRPPTPPREPSISAVDQSLKPMLNRSVSTDSQLSLQTPPNISTPSSVATESDLGSARIRKKVGWSIHTQYKDPPQYREGHRAYKSSPLSAPSSSLSKPVKGILKPSSSPHVLSPSLDYELNVLATQATITEMLDSTIKQLAGPDRESKLDAYMMLARALKTSNNLPDRVALQDKMSLFTQFIQRDVISKNEKGSLDSSLVNHALNLLATFLHFPAIASMLASDFAIFIVEHSIRSFQQPTMPKDVTRHLMQVVAFQNFSAKVMTLDRIGRLVAALHNIEDHVKGKSIIMGRIQIYKRLVKQSRSHMSVHSDWLKDVLTDMLSTIKDIRSQAVSLGLEAAYSLRSDKQFMRKAMDVLQTSDDDQTYIQFYIQHLEEMIKDKASSSAVPQIWSVVTALLRCPLDRWEHYNPWLKLAQSAFNSADAHTKQEANYAWSRYVYLCLLDGKATPKALGVLCQPLLSQLRRKSSAKPSEDATKLRRVVIGAICTLLYYAFKPTDNIYSHDLVWDVVAQPIMEQLSNATGKAEIMGDGFTQASRILVGVLDSSTPRVWREDRIMDLSLVKPEELPSIDPKWVRRNSVKILKVVGPIIQRKSLDLAKEETITYRLWHALVGSIAAASRKDIKVSEDTTQFFACSLGVLSRIWTEGVASQDQVTKQKLYLGVQNFVKILFEGLGMLPFTEKKISMPVAHAYEPSATPSHYPDRASKLNGDVRSPLHHLFLMLSIDLALSADDEDFVEFYLGVFEPFFNGKPSKYRLEMARELIELLPRSISSTTGPWILAAKHIGCRLEKEEAKPESKPPSAERLLGPEYREVVSLLERGILGHTGQLSQHWTDLFNLLSEHVMEAFGDAGRGLVLIEPLAKFLLENYATGPTQLTEGVVQVNQRLFEIAKAPQDRQTLDAVRRRLWGVPAVAKRGNLPEPFDNLNKLANWILETLYNDCAEFHPSRTTAPYIQAVDSFLENFFDQKETSCLRKLQTSLGLWIHDEKAHVSWGDNSPVAQALEHLWDRIISYLTSCRPVDRSFLEELEPLFTAALKSRHNVIVTKTMETWDSLSKKEVDFDCPASLKSIVSSLRSRMNPTPRSGPESGGESGAQNIPFAGPQGDLSFIASSSTSSQHAVQTASAEAKVATRSASSRRRRGDTTPEVVPTRRSKRNTVSRLRHDDSQIHFAPVAPSLLTEESQHLTEHQKEVRERQKENATMYAQIQSSSPPQSAARTTRQTKMNRASSNNGEQASTPKRGASYEELISSTPTPRRGQLVHLDELNDPPSSPPEPRPYPLLSEIQSRSRGRDSLENWEFSSPPTSPVTSRQQVIDETDIPHVTLTNDTTQHKSQSQRSSMQDADMAEVIPSSFDTEFAANASSKGNGLAPAAGRHLMQVGIRRRLTTPPRKQQMAPNSKVQETPRSGDDEFVDARSSPEPSSPNLPPLRSHLKHMTQAKASSVTSMGNSVNSSGGFVVELGSRPAELHMHVIGSQSPEKSKTTTAADGCILVHADSSPSPKITRTSPSRSASPEVPSTAIEAMEPTAKAPKKRKRGGLKASESRRKKRRSEDREASHKNEKLDADNKEKNSAIASGEPSLQDASIGVQTRRSLKRQRQQEAKAEKAVSKLVEVEGGDTDEELMSQLVTESEAASQSQSQHELPSTIEDSLANTDPERKSAKRRRSERRLRYNQEQEKANEKANEKATQILETLRNGLGVLRDAKLSRSNVYEIEDVLMDMKRELFQAERRGRKGLGK